MVDGRIEIIGTVVTTAKVNLRHGAPNTHAPVTRKIAPGSTIQVYAVVVGQAIQGNRTWYEVSEGYVWAGACEKLKPTVASLPSPAPAQGTSISTLPMPTVPSIVDLYHLDEVTSFYQAAEAGLRGVIHKVSTGGTGYDRLYGERRLQAIDAGLLWGATHWGTAAPVQDQISNFLRHAKIDDDTLVALDFEVTKGDDMTLQQAVKFLEMLETAIGRSPVLYGGDKLRRLLGGRPNGDLSKYRLWLAEYGVGLPKPMPGWSSFWLWQYTDGKSYPKQPYPNRVPGVTGNERGQLDCDYFPMGENILETEWSGR